MSHPLISRIQTTFESKADPKIKEGSKRYFKEPINVHGLSSKDAGALGKDFYEEVKNLSKPEMFHVCELLWQTGIFEENILACNWSYECRKEFIESDIDIFEQWIKTYVSNWATCDTLCNHTIGAIVEQYPQLITRLVQWTQSKNRWMKRAAAVSLIIPARHGKFLPEIFTIADKLLLDPDDLVQKGYGWMLKATSQAHQQQVFEYVLKHKAVMPRTALRYAIEKMPDNLKKEAMKK